MTKKQKRQLFQTSLSILVVLAIFIFGVEEVFQSDSTPSNQLNQSENSPPASPVSSSSNISSLQIASSSSSSSTTISPASSTPTSSLSVQLQDLEAALVTRIIDGDTVELADGRKLRYIGVDTPETKDPRRPVGCFGQEASDFNRQLVENKVVWLEKDISETDRYGRLLRYVYLTQDDDTLLSVQEILVREGFAKVSSYPPDVKYIEHFRTLQSLAQTENKGLWSANNCPADNSP